MSFLLGEAFVPLSPCIGIVSRDITTTAAATKSHMLLLIVIEIVVVDYQR